jgi:hypothetical protein
LSIDSIAFNYYLIRDPPENQWKLLYKIGENIKKQLKALSHDPVIGF